MMPPGLSPTFKLFIGLLNAYQVEYLLVGGFAVRYYGYHRQTVDLDLWTATHPANALKLAAACRDFGLGIPELTPELFQQGMRIFHIVFPPARVEVLNPVIGQKPEVLAAYHGTQSGQIELLTVQSGADFDTCFAERIEGLLDGVQVHVVSLHHLKEIKQAGNRPQDSDDLKHLR